MATRYYYKDYDKHSDTPKMHYTQASFIGWTRGGLLNAWYAQFQRKSEVMLIPHYLLTKETRALLPSLPQELVMAEDIASLQEIMSGPRVGPYTFEELCQLLTQR